MSASGAEPRAMGANEATPAEAARGPGATTGASAVTVQWASAAVAPAPTRAGGYEDTPVGRLPTGPAADAALAAAAAGGPAAESPPSATRGRDAGEPRAARRRRAVAVAAAALGAAAAAGVAARIRRRSRRRLARFTR